jgi:hypothetical protein
MIKRFFPQDSRVVELASAGSLIFMGISLMVVGERSPFLHHPEEFWVVLSLIFGFLQLIGVAGKGSLHILRTIAGWVCGSFWVWVGLQSFVDGVHPADFSTLFLGLSNWYAFILNIDFLRLKWTDSQ